MIIKLSEFLTEKLLLNNSIFEEERELFIYGFFTMFSFTVFFVLASVFGLVLKCFIESILFYIAFMFIRRFAGGYHAATEVRCSIISTLCIFISILIIKLSLVYGFQTVLSVISLFSSIIIFFLCPLDTPEKRLTQKEFKRFRKKSRITVLIIAFVVIISYFLKLYTLSVPCSVSLVLESILLTCGKIKELNMNRP